MIKKRISLFLRWGVLIYLFVTCRSNPTGTATLRFSILDEHNRLPVPSKLTFLKGNSDKIKLDIPDRFDLAPEDNGFYTVSGMGEVHVPAGSYTVYASRGMEYSIDRKRIRLAADSVVDIEWLIRREIDPKGYIGADFHMHTLNSDGNCTEEERVISLVGEGVEFAVATDHNYVTDFSPAVKNLGVTEYITTCAGNELSTDIGHFNIFPLPPQTEPFDSSPTDPNILFAYRDEFPGPIVNQVSHPRWEGIDYFNKLDVHPLSTESENPHFSCDFDAMEIMNETIGWGLITGKENKVSVWGDWFNLLNRGFRVTGVGNSDSHTLLRMPVGWPRNYVASSTDVASELDVSEIARNIIKNRVSVARGVFVDLVVNTHSAIGSDVVDIDGEVDLRVDVIAPSWVDVNTVTVYGNGRQVWKERFGTDAGPTYYTKTFTMFPEVDTWYIVRAEGKKTMWPIIPDQGTLPVTPVGFTNPVWIDIDGKGFETERDRAMTFIKDCGGDIEIFRRSVVEKDEWFMKQCLALVDEETGIGKILYDALMKIDRPDLKIPED